MSLYYGGKTYKRLGITNGIGLDTSDADITSPDMQNGRIGYANGKRVVGTGKCFEKAGYGDGIVGLMYDNQGNEKYGISIFTKVKPNVVFITPTVGDVFVQTEHIIDLKSNTALTIGTNYTLDGNIYISYSNNRLNIYFENILNAQTELKYFYGKDNQL